MAQAAGGRQAKMAGQRKPGGDYLEKQTADGRGRTLPDVVFIPDENSLFSKFYLCNRTFAGCFHRLPHYGGEACESGGHHLIHKGEDGGHRVGSNKERARLVPICNY